MIDDIRSSFEDYRSRKKKLQDRLPALEELTKKTLQTKNAAKMLGISSVALKNRFRNPDSWKEKDLERLISAVEKFQREIKGEGST